MALDQSALLELTDALRSTDGGDRDPRPVWPVRDRAGVLARHVARCEADLAAVAG